MSVQKILHKASVWTKHGHPVAVRGEYCRMIRESREHAERRKRRSTWFRGLRDLWASMGKKHR